MPTVKPFDAAWRQDLADRTEYEAWALDLFRTKFFNQDENPNSLVTFNLGNTNEKGELLARAQLSIVTRLSDEGVKNAISRFRVLAFTSAFKLQDMIAEWIMEANGEHIWRFSEKLAKYDKLHRAGTLHQPPEFLANTKLSSAFWELYRKLEPPRGAVIHTGKLKVYPTGEIETIDRRGAVLRLDVRSQATYVRVTSLLTAMLSGRLPPNGYLDAVVENDLAVLAHLHGVSTFTARSIRFEAVCIDIPSSFAKTKNPYVCEVDLQPIVSRMEATTPVGAGGRLYLALEIVADAGERDLVWNIPPEKVVGGKLELREDDLALQPYLEIRPRPATLTNSPPGSRSA